MSLPPAPLRKVTLIEGRRIGQVVTPDGAFRSHGLGLVGEPLIPYLGARAEGYEVSFPVNLGDVQIYEVDAAGERDLRGYYPQRRVPWAALGMPDEELDAIRAEAQRAAAELTAAASTGDGAK